MERVRVDWDSLKEKEELKIMHKHANSGRRYTFITMIIMYTMIFLHTLIFFSTHIFNTLIPLNKSRTNREHLWHLPNMMEHFIDREKYIYLLIVYLLLIGFIGATVLLVVDSLCIMYIQHITALFQITSYRIERIVSKSRMKSLGFSKKSDTYENIAKTIDSHQRAVEFLNSMQSMYEIVYMFLIPISVVTLSINLYQFYEHIISGTEGIVIWLGYIACHFSTMFLHNYFGQQIIDYSNNIFKKLCSIQWYMTPLYTQKCLLFMMRRNMKSSKIMISSVFTASLEGFATVKHE
ncbi:uncharacterized protein LOC109610247 isoform X2 [Camponotus floridanus]|uniref:uncharacterized protein LOC109610247 isoform X2 n=1 Tax=Camponotus floridanus TaxID=104421 RepID=UPI000DC68947|nr:uncharacterized protein LOC109610247 isoform X2 [Camponotus floridanus]